MCKNPYVLGKFQFVHHQTKPAILQPGFKISAVKIHTPYYNVPPMSGLTRWEKRCGPQVVDLFGKAICKLMSGAGKVNAAGAVLVDVGGSKLGIPGVECHKATRLQNLHKSVAIWVAGASLQSVLPMVLACSTNAWCCIQTAVEIT